MRYVSCLVRVLAGCMAAASAHGVSGTLSDTSGNPVAGAYVALMSREFAPVSAAFSEKDGSVPMPGSAKDGFIVVQPPAKASKEGLQVFSVHPRIFQYEGEPRFDIKLPPAANIVLEAYDASGKLMRWEDFEKNGKYGGQFMYATNLDDEAVPMTAWPVHGEPFTNMTGGPREKGLPGLMVEPGRAACVAVMFWPTKDYGKLLLRADNRGKGYTLPAPGDALLLNLNVELARTAVHGLEVNAASYPEGAEAIRALSGRLEALPKEGKAAAAEADAILAEALRLRDGLELARARAAIPAVRNNGLHISLANANQGKYGVSAKQKSRHFLFGVYEGSPYNAKAWEAARKGGFDFATVLPAWNWTQHPRAKSADIDRVFGLGALEKLGYRIKAHGVVWMQGHGILPDHALKLSPQELSVEAIEHQKAFLETFGGRFAIVEAMNEPANTNVPNLPGEDMKQLLAAAAGNVVELEKPALVNSPHEFSYGGKYWLYRLDGTPVDHYPVTFSAFLKEVQQHGQLDGVSIVGLQCYPGFHLNEDWGNVQGPAYTPAHLLDTLRRYKRFGKTIHITELSFPSSYGRDWFSGYWREEWTPETQADYAEAVYTLAYAEPMVQSVTWWDISDAKPSVITGGLLERSGKPKPVFERITGLIAQWQPAEVEATLEGGQAELELPGGEWEITVTGPGGFQHTETLQLLGGWKTTLTVDAGG